MEATGGPVSDETGYKIDAIDVIDVIDGNAEIKQDVI